MENPNDAKKQGRKDCLLAIRKYICDHQGKGIVVKKGGKEDIM